MIINKFKYTYLETKIRKLFPGIVLSFTIAAAAMFLSEHYTAPVMLFALLLGIGFHFLADNQKTGAGVEFVSKNLLRIGVALLGARVTIGQITSLGFEPVIGAIVSVALTITIGVFLAIMFGRTKYFGLLTAGAVAICGASAALAIQSVLPKYDKLEQNTLFTVITITTLSTIAMIIYPIIFSYFGFNDTEMGILIGLTIHDVAQVVGAGYAVSDEAGDIATYVKLLRVSMLPIIAIIIAFSMHSGKRMDASRFPWFVIGFVVILLFNSLGLIPEMIRLILVDISRWLLVGAISALGIKTSLESLLKMGYSSIIIVVLQTLFLMLLAVAIVPLF